MSYDIRFKVKIEGIDKYIPVGSCNANATWNIRDMIVKSTKLQWYNEANNGLCKDIIPHIIDGYAELCRNPEKYKQYESSNGWGTIESCKKFFLQIINAWDMFCEDIETKELVDVTYFWIE